MAIIKKFRIKSFKTEKPILKLDKISLSFGNRKILDNIKFSLNEGQVLGLLGPNGVGKSTIFNIITGLIKPDYGSIIINSKTANDYPIYLRTKKFRLGFCPQNSGYFHDLTLLENLNTIGEILIENKKIRNEKIDSMISKFELDSVKDVKANYLSGGQKKKLVIALALLSNPKILLLDEPFAALDVMTIKMLQKIIVDLQSEDNISVILCDHQARDLLTCVDLAIVLSNCKIVASGTPSELINNNEAKSAYFGDSFKLG
ncbi:MAG: ATP-binding cassette domain-containing protein [Candidatus Pelagibacter sp. TMED106]|jgi:lipopolysaccharide export system ATP-binding protein|nr:MAG: ATP-binding cassette domain-containing protein [Candidatus Pelagibacter sp. TMED106]|tara:strand:+ start:151 stop:927 length:777 start_codon:yes stop_codon:yes gene_type:complete